MKDRFRYTDELYSVYIRLKECLETTGTLERGICITCGKNIEFGKSDAGHFISRDYKNLRYDDKNVHIQCIECNRFKNVSDDYFIAMERKYGRKVVDELRARKNIIKQWKDWELKELRKEIRLKIKRLKK